MKLDEKIKKYSIEFDDSLVIDVENQVVREISDRSRSLTGYTVDGDFVHYAGAGSVSVSYQMLGEPIPFDKIDNMAVSPVHVAVWWDNDKQDWWTRYIFPDAPDVPIEEGAKVYPVVVITDRIGSWEYVCTPDGIARLPVSIARADERRKMRGKPSIRYTGIFLPAKLIE